MTRGEESRLCPACSTGVLTLAHGLCETCRNCGFSACSV
jgi:ribosomal protein S27AE